MKTAKQILQGYNRPIPRSTTSRRRKAEKILTLKLCRCLKKLEPKFRGRAVGICTKTIFGRKGLTRGKFRCKQKQTVKYRRK